MLNDNSSFDLPLTLVPSKYLLIKSISFELEFVNTITGKNVETGFVILKFSAFTILLFSSLAPLGTPYITPCFPLPIKALR